MEGQSDVCLPHPKPFSLPEALSLSLFKNIWNIFWHLNRKQFTTKVAVFAHTYVCQPICFASNFFLLSEFKSLENISNSYLKFKLKKKKNPTHPSDFDDRMIIVWLTPLSTTTESLLSMHLGSGLPTYTQFPLTMECPLAALQLTDTQESKENTTACTVWLV